jgi:glycosyltransferase involved in cell wall biosynthesis
MKVLSFVNSGNSTSIPVEVAAKINDLTDVHVAIATFYDDSLEDIDPDVATLDVEFHTLGASSRFDIGAYRRLRDLLKEFDILHTNHNSVGSLGRLAAVGTGVQIVNTEHNNHKHFSHPQNLSNCPTYPLISRLICNSKSTRHSFRRYEKPFLALTDCTTIYNGVDFERIDASRERDDHPSLPAGKRIVTAATLSEQKNVLTLVTAMERVLDEVPEAELIVVGDGPLRERAERRAAELGVNGSTTFLGYLPEREQVYRTLWDCHMYAVPSWYEGFCNAAVEAMGCGLPVVASDINVLREVVGDGGRFAPPSDPDAFAGALIDLFRNDAERRELGRVAKRRARSQFSIERTVEKYVAVYRAVMED